MNSEETGVQSIFCGVFVEKIEIPDTKDFQIYPFSTAVCPFSINSDLKEEKCDGTDYSNPVMSCASPFQDLSSAKLESPDRGRKIFEQDSSRIYNAKHLKYKKKAPRRHIGDETQRTFSCAICAKNSRDPPTSRMIFGFTWTNDRSAVKFAQRASRILGHSRFIFEFT